MHGEDAVHAGEIERDAAEGRIDVAFERGAGAEGDHRHSCLRAKRHHLDHLGGRFREQHRIGGLRRDPGQGVGMLLAQRSAGREASPEARGKLGE